MKPNVAIVKICSADLIDRSGLGFSGPFCKLVHRLPDLEKNFSTKHNEFCSASPVWNESEVFAIRL